MNSSVRLLLIVREPVTRAISDFTQLRSRATPSVPAHALAPGHTPHLSSDAAKPFEHLAISPDGSINVAYRYTSGTWLLFRFSFVMISAAVIVTFNSLIYFFACLVFV